ncbi:hypothetical protein [Streptomyces sp. NPDC004134]|uniref:hypothetical protein n=1 Tax=Streptomyces sp. NPDC004134 TaxID=3364691 RepID=UPI0036982B79
MERQRRPGARPVLGLAGLRLGYLQNCGTAYVTNSHRTLTVCDEEADGLGFWTAFKRSDGGTGTIKDPNGSAAGCGSGTAPSGVKITQVRLIQHLGDGVTVYLGDWRTVS